MILLSATDITGDANMVPPRRSNTVVSPIGSAQLGADSGVGFGPVEIAFQFIAAATEMHHGVRGHFGALLLTAGWQLGWTRAPW